MQNNKAGLEEKRVIRLLRTNTHLIIVMVLSIIVISLSISNDIHFSKQRLDQLSIEFKVSHSVLKQDEVQDSSLQKTSLDLWLHEYKSMIPAEMQRIKAV